MIEFFRNIILIITRGRLYNQRLDGRTLTIWETADVLLNEMESLQEVARSEFVSGDRRRRMTRPRPNVRINYTILNHYKIIFLSIIIIFQTSASLTLLLIIFQHVQYDIQQRMEQREEYNTLITFAISAFEELYYPETDGSYEI